MAQTTSELWADLWSRGARKEYQFDVNGTIYGEDDEVSHAVEHALFDELGIGNATIGKLTYTFFADTVPKGATIKRYVRLVKGDEVSEWLPAGVFFTNRRSVEDDEWTVEAFDAMRKAEVVWEPDQSLEFPMTAPDAVAEFCRIMDVELDERTELDESIMLDYPSDSYTIRNGLEYVAAAHGGNFIITPSGALRLVPLIPSETLHEIGDDLMSVKDNGLRDAISRVTLWVDDETCYTSGDDTGLEIEADCPIATQAIADAVAAKLSGYAYQAYSAEAVNIDPAAELGDLVTVGDISSFLASVSDDGCGHPDISAPGEQELDDEYGDSGPLQQALERKIASTRAEIKKTADSITLSVTSNDDGTSSYFELKLGEAVLSSGNITFDGLVTFKGLEDGTTIIDGGCIQTGTILADLIKAGKLQSEDGKTFVLDLDKGTFSMQGSGRFQSESGNTYIEVDGDELVMYSLDESSGEYLDKIHIGFITGTNPSGTENVDYPYILLGNTGTTSGGGLVKKFYNGLFIGNSAVKSMSGNFSGATGASGIFINTREGKTYVVNGTDMQDVYTGDAVATFG